MQLWFPVRRKVGFLRRIELPAPSETTMTPKAFEEMLASFIRAVTNEGYYLVGVIFRENPQPDIVVLRNTQDEPTELLHAAASMVETLQARNGKRDIVIGRVN